MCVCVGGCADGVRQGTNKRDLHRSTPNELIPDIAVAACVGAAADAGVDLWSADEATV